MLVVLVVLDLVLDRVQERVLLLVVVPLVDEEEEDVVDGPVGFQRVLEVVVLVLMH